MSESDAETTEVVGKLLIVRSGGALHAIPVSRVEEVLPALPIESVPQCPAYIRGVVFVRGHLIPVVNAAEKLGLKAERCAGEPHIVCLRIRGRVVGVEFDEAMDLVDVGKVESLDAETIGASEGFFAGVIEHAGNIIRLLDPEKLFGEMEAGELDGVSRTA